MAKIDLALIHSDGHGKPVPKEMDRHIIKFVVGNRKNAIEENSTLFQTEPWDHSDVFYAARTWLNQHDWDTSVYNDNTTGGASRRKDFYDMIKSVCEDYYHVKRHQIGIYPEDRAVMAYGGVMYAVSFDNLQNLMYRGTDVVGVEKQGTVIKMAPFTRNNGVGFIQSQGFVSEYGVALARLANRDQEAEKDYLDHSYSSRPYRANTGNLTDCDSSGIVIGMKLKGATRLGVDLDTIDEINQVNKGLEDELDIDLHIKLEDLEESNDANSHWDGLVGITNRSGKLHESLTIDERIFYRRNLLTKPAILGGDIRFIDYLEEHRIELNTVLAIVKPQAFWNWLRWKLLKTWPSRNYLRGGLGLRDIIRSPTMNRFIDFYDGHTEAITMNTLENERIEMMQVEGMYDDTDGFRDNVPIVKKVIMGDAMNEVVLQDKRIQKIDLALEKIMKNGDSSTSKKSKSEVDDEDEDEEEYDGDGNEWND
jgi:hypothetical protein